MISKSSSKSSSASLLNATQVSPEPGSSLAESPSCPHSPGAPEGDGPREGGSDEEPLAAGLQSQQSGGVQGV